MTGTPPDPTPDSSPGDTVDTLREAGGFLLLSLLLFVGIPSVPVLGPLFGPLAAAISPAPLAVLCLRQGEPVLFATAFVGAVVLSSISGLVAGGIFVLVAAFAFLVSRGLAFDWPPQRVVGLSAILLTGVVLIGLQQAGGVEEFMTAQTAVWSEDLRNSGASPEQIKVFEASIADKVGMAQHMAPLIFLTLGIGASVATMLATRTFFFYRPHPVVTLVPLRNWVLPDQWIWGLIASAVLLLISTTEVRYVGANLLGLFVTAYALQGWAIAVHFFYKHKVNPLAQSGFYLMAIMPPFSMLMMALLTVIGGIDLWLDFRSVRPQDDADAPPDDTPPPKESDD